MNLNVYINISILVLVDEPKIDGQKPDNFRI